MEEKKIIAYKGFDENLRCRGYQFEVGKEYEQEGEIVCCENGFHACTNPFDVLNHYDANGKNRFCIVEQSGVIKTEGDFDTKQASSKIKIKEEIGISGLFKAAIEWIKGITNTDVIAKETKEKDNIEFSACAKISSSSFCDKIGSSGDYATIGSIGDDVQIGSSGSWARIGSSGCGAKIGSSGYFAKIASSGEYAQIGSSGEYANIGSSGCGARISSSGYGAKIDSSGYGVEIGSSGYNAAIASSGDYARIWSSGYGAQIASSGFSANIDSTGEYAIICCAGHKSMAKAKKGSWISLAEWKYSEEKKHIIPVCVKTEFVDGERIKEDTWYKLVDGEFKEV